MQHICYPLVTTGFFRCLFDYIESGDGRCRLPFTELSYYGVTLWGIMNEQYEKQKKCEEL
jgi:hypothetical protein